MVAYARALWRLGMKTLFVLRHGHAASDEEAGSDHERELTPRGTGEVRRAAQRLLEQGHAPTLLLSSSAVRARQSAELCQAVWQTRPELQLLEGLYLAPPPSYLAELAARGDPHASVMVVGHNPGLEALIYVLTERSEHLATASLVEIALSVDSWRELSAAARGLGTIVHGIRA
jgi:phosphohistidine phosphatase